MMEKEEKVYVAGHRGMVGSAICRALRRKGYGNLVLRTHGELYLTRQKEDFFREERPDYVFFAAAKVGGILANSVALAGFMYENMFIEMNVIHAAWKNSCKRLLFLESSCIYPRLAPQPMPEGCLLTSELEPTNEAYALTKINGLKYCEYLNHQCHKVGRGDVVHICLGQRHAILATENLHLIVVQIDMELAENDIERFEWSWS